MMDDVLKTCPLCSNVFLSAGAGSLAAMFYYQWQLSGDSPNESFYPSPIVVMEHDGDATRISQGKTFINEGNNGLESTLYICAVFPTN